MYVYLLVTMGRNKFDLLFCEILGGVLNFTKSQDLIQFQRVGTLVLHFVTNVLGSFLQLPVENNKNMPVSIIHLIFLISVSDWLSIFVSSRLLVFDTLLMVKNLLCKDYCFDKIIYPNKYLMLKITLFF